MILLVCESRKLHNISHFSLLARSCEKNCETRLVVIPTHNTGLLLPKTTLAGIFTRIKRKIVKFFISTGLVAVSGSCISLRAPWWGGEPPPPVILASRWWGPTYIASYTQTLGSWVCLHMKLYRYYCGGGASDHLGRQRRLLHGPKQPSTTHPGTTALSSTYGWDLL
jgi:hypothetical protein